MRKWVVLIPKAGRVSHAATRKCGPITITFFILKTIENLVDRNIPDRPLSKTPFSGNQHGYRTESSSESTLSTVEPLLKAQMRVVGFAIRDFINIDEQ